MHKISQSHNNSFHRIWIIWNMPWSSVKFHFTMLQGCSKHNGNNDTLDPNECTATAPDYDCSQAFISHLCRRYAPQCPNVKYWEYVHLYVQLCEISMEAKQGMNSSNRRLTCKGWGSSRSRGHQTSTAGCCTPCHTRHSWTPSSSWWVPYSCAMD
jgi:hypothetical protein